MGRTRRTSRLGGARTPPSRGGALTTRAVILGLTLAVLALTLAYPVKQYLSQRHQIATLRSQHAAENATVQSLRKQIARWDDPAYVKAQARERLHYVLPGETAYVVIGQRAPAAPGAAKPAAPRPGSSPGSSGQAWYSQLWHSVQQAGTPAQPAPDVPAPSPAPSPPAVN